MKFRLFLTACLLSNAAIAATPIDGWYGGGFGGYTYLPNDIDTIYHGLLLNHSRYEAGYNAGGRFGYQTNPLRYEIEVTYLRADIDRFFVNNIQELQISGHSDAVLGMANVYYDFPATLPCLSPFLGAGIGYAWINADLNGVDLFSFYGFQGSNSAFAYQATAGLTFNFAENYALNIAYRYVGTDHVSELGSNLQAHLASVGAVYRFDEANYN